MRPATIRRLLVLGVCAVGVGALYLIPSVAGTPGQIGPGSSREPPSTPQPVGRVTQRSIEPMSVGAADEPVVAGTTNGPPRVAEVPRTEPGQGSRRERGVAPQVRTDAPDREAPSTVTDLTFPTVRPDRLTIRWARASDNVGVTSYRIWLNGFHVADTTELQVAVPWFSDGSRQQVVQVRAVDAAGNQSEDAPARLVDRPAPPSPTPTPTPAAAAGTPRSTPSTESVAPDTETSTGEPNG